MPRYKRGGVRRRFKRPAKGTRHYGSQSCKLAAAAAASMAVDTTEGSQRQEEACENDNGYFLGSIYRPQKLQSIPVNDTNGCLTYLKSEVKVENHEPHSFKDKPNCFVDKPLDSKMSLNESQCSFEENLYSHSFDEVPITSEGNPLHSEMSVDASQETWDPDFFKEKSATFVESPIKSEMSLITSQFTFEDRLDSHSFEEEPITSVDNQLNSEMSLTASQFLFEDTMVPVSHPLNNSHKRQKDPLAISPVKGRPDNSHHPTDQLLARAAEALRMRLKPNWICLLEGQGIHSMQLSRNFEKCTQRRIFFNTCGDVHLSVHCVPIPITNFVPCLRMVKLCNEHDISAFVDGMERIVDIIRQLEICTGVYHDKYKSLWQSSKRGEIDKNPYQEARYSLTLRSLQCSRLVRPRRRMCHSCSRLLDTLRLKARSRAMKLKAHSIP